MRPRTGWSPSCRDRSLRSPATQAAVGRSFAGAHSLAAVQDAPYMTAVEHSQPATAAVEQPVFIASPLGDLFAVVTRPTGPDSGLAAVLLRGGGWRPSSGPRRTQVRLARRLAAAGLHGVRFSYHGVAESGGRSEEVFRLDQPFVEDLDAVGRWVASQ